MFSIRRPKKKKEVQVICYLLTEEKYLKQCLNQNKITVKNNRWCDRFSLKIVETNGDITPPSVSYSLPMILILIVFRF